MKVKLLMAFITIFAVVSCLEKKDDDDLPETLTTTINVNCQKELSSCSSATAIANGKTAYIYYLQNNCQTLDPENNGVTSTDVLAWAKVTMSCSTNGCTGSTTTWYDTNDNKISNPPSAGIAGTRSFVTYVDLNEDATDTDGINGLQSGDDIISDCSDIAATEPYGSHELSNFNNY